MLCFYVHPRDGLARHATHFVWAETEAEALFTVMMADPTISADRSIVRQHIDQPYPRQTKERRWDELLEQVNSPDELKAMRGDEWLRRLDRPDISAVIQSVLSGEVHDFAASEFFRAADSLSEAQSQALDWLVGEIEGNAETFDEVVDLARNLMQDDDDRESC